MNSSTHPLAPPTQEEDLVAWLRLIRSRRVGATTFFRLLGEHGSAEAALDALPGVARGAGVERYTPCPPDAARRELAAGRAAGAQLVSFADPAYPRALRDIADAPPLLWAKGDLSLLTRPMVALVGARNASSLGTRMARKLAQDLGEAGVVTVSGLARGIDAAAHHASIATGTVAVLAGGIDVIYPAENAALADQIAMTGLLLTEQPPGLQPQARHFPMRNRIISGLVGAVVVIEAAARSGSLITAKTALDQGRDVLAVPGHPFDARAWGCNMLIRDGAALVRGAKDVLEAIGPAEPAAASPRQPDLLHDIPEGPPPRPKQEIRALHDQILNRLGPAPLAEDQLIRDMGQSPAHIAPALFDLELDGKIERQPGGLLARLS